MRHIPASFTACSANLASSIISGRLSMLLFHTKLRTVMCAVASVSECISMLSMFIDAVSALLFIMSIVAVSMLLAKNIIHLRLSEVVCADAFSSS